MFGLESVDDYLSERLSKSDVERLLTSTYSSKLLFSDVFAAMEGLREAPIANVDDVYDEFDSVFDSSCTFRKSYSQSGKFDDELAAMRESKDEFAIAIAHEGSKYDWTPVLNSYMAARKGEQVDAMLACMHLYLYPEDIYKFPTLHLSSFFPKACFGVDFDEPPTDIKVRIAKEKGGRFRDAVYSVPSVDSRELSMRNVNRMSDDIESSRSVDDLDFLF